MSSATAEKMKPIKFQEYIMFCDQFDGDTFCGMDPIDQIVFAKASRSSENELKEALNLTQNNGYLKMILTDVLIANFPIDESETLKAGQ